MGRRVGRIEADNLVEAHDRRIVVLLPVPHGTEEGPRHLPVGFQADRVLQVGDGLVNLLHRVPDHRTAHEGILPPRIDLNGLIEIGDRLVALPLGGPALPADVVGDHVVGVEAKGRIEVRECPVRLPFLEPGGASEGVGPLILGIEANERIPIGDGLIALVPPQPFLRRWSSAIRDLGSSLIAAWKSSRAGSYSCFSTPDTAPGEVQPGGVGLAVKLAGEVSRPPSRRRRCDRTPPTPECPGTRAGSPPRPSARRCTRGRCVIADRRAGLEPQGPHSSFRTTFRPTHFGSFALILRPCSGRTAQDDREHRTRRSSERRRVPPSRIGKSCIPRTRLNLRVGAEEYPSRVGLHGQGWRQIGHSPDLEWAGRTHRRVSAGDAIVTRSNRRMKPSASPTTRTRRVGSLYELAFACRSLVARSDRAATTRALGGSGDEPPVPTSPVAEPAR